MRPSLRLLVLLATAAALVAACSDGGDTAPSTPPTGAFDVITPERRSPPEVATPWRGEGDRVEVSVWEMHCAGCEGAVESALGAVEGVMEVEADHVTSLVTIRLEDPASREALIPRLRDAIHGAGRQVLGEDAVDSE